MSAAGAPNYSKFQVIKKVKTKFKGTYRETTKFVDIPGKVVGLNYYESLYSPMVTANFLEVDTGGITFVKSISLTSTPGDTKNPMIVFLSI